jgi:hypothetical protein
MKKHVFLFIILITNVYLKAQFTQINHAPANGETFEMYQCDSTGITAGTSGTNSTWNYGALNKHNSLLQSYTVSTVNSMQYPLANVAAAASASNMSYYRSKPDTLYYYGGNIAVGAIAANLTYSSPALFAKYPMSYGAQINSTTGGSIVASQPFPANGAFSGFANVSVDGSGTLTLPGNKVFNSTTRIVTSQTINFNLLVPGSVIQRSYDFYAVGTKAPLLSIVASTLNTQLGGTSTQTLVFLNKGSLITSNFDLSKPAFEVYPNPAQHIINIESTQNAQLRILDINGRCISEMGIKTGSTKLEVGNSKPGIYTLHIVFTDGSQSIKKIILTH